MPFQTWEKVEKEQVIYSLTELKTLFADQSKWIDWPIAENKAGNGVEACSPDAVKWSLMGASYKIAEEKFGSDLARYIDCATREILDELSEETIIGKMLTYEEEYALICLGLELISAKEEGEAEAKSEEIIVAVIEQDEKAAIE